MKRLTIAAALLAGAAVPAAAADETLRADIQGQWEDDLQALFTHFHENPELSFRETETAKRMAAELRAAGLDVTEGVGETGVVGVLENGPGPVVMLRADMDGLPVKEDSGLAYASTATQRDIDGEVKPVMHACGHDTHITAMVGTARALAKRKDEWSGTLVFIVQPAEERIDGARAMLADGLYERFPKPAHAVAFHVSADTPTGKIEIQPGLAYSSADSVDITIHGVGAHGAAPHKGKDPIVMGAEIVMALQTLVARELSPLEAGVVTVGAFHSGFKHNIISDRAELQLTVRSNDVEVREKLLAGIERIAKSVGRMNGLPQDQWPDVRVGFESTPPTLNDPALTARVTRAFAQHFGEDALITDKPQTSMGAEDFAYFIEPDTGVAGTYFSVGGTPQAALDAEEAGGPSVPSHHSPLFKVDARPAVTLGAEAMAVAALELLKK